MRTPCSPTQKGRPNISPVIRRDTNRFELDDQSERRAGYVEAAEFEQVIRPGYRYLLEEAGTMNGKRLWQVLRQRLTLPEEGTD